jgi:pyocin large subunit-like protein
MLRRAARLLLVFWVLAAFLAAAGAGFRSKRSYDDHFAKHGREFGRITQPEYLILAQALRDAPVGGPILEARKSGGVFTKFDKRKGYVGAYNRDKTIRTFFVPNDGERYFWRQASRPE